MINPPKPTFVRSWNFENPDYNPLQIADISKAWCHIPDQKIKSLICAEEQFLHYHRFLARELRSTTNSTEYPKQELTLSLRAGMIRTEIFLLGGICEAALHAHAIASKIPEFNNKATFGALLKVWNLYGKIHIEKVYEDLEHLRNARNTIHLYAALGLAEKIGETFWRTIVAEESRTAEMGDKLLIYFKEFRNPGLLQKI